MDEFGSKRSKTWNIHTSSNHSPSSQTGVHGNAITFGIVATAILISMFLIMAIFEHLFRPSPTLSSSHQDGTIETRPGKKLRNVTTTSYAIDFPVLMPGQHYPTYIAQLAPLPCRREGVFWPSHEHNFAYDT